MGSNGSCCLSSRDKSLKNLTIEEYFKQYNEAARPLPGFSSPNKKGLQIQSMLRTAPNRRGDLGFKSAKAESRKTKTMILD